MSTNNTSFFDIFIDEEVVHQSDVEDEESISDDELRLEAQRISAQSRANRERNVSTGFSSNEPVPGYDNDDSHVVFDVRALIREAFTMLRGLPDRIRRMMNNPNPAQPSLVFEYAAVRAKFESLSEEDFLKLSPAEVLSKDVDILAKVYAIYNGENSLKNICGGNANGFIKQPSNFIVRGFLVMKISPTEEDAVLFAESDEAKGGRKRAQEMKLLADIEGRRRRDKGNAIPVLVKVKGRIVGKFPSIVAVSEAFYTHVDYFHGGTLRATGGIDMFGANFSAFSGSEEQFVALPMAHDHYDQLAKLIDERLLQLCSNEIFLSRQGTTLGPFANTNTGKLISSNPLLSWPTSHLLSILLKCLHFRRWMKTNI